MGSFLQSSTMKVLIVVASLVVMSSSRPRFLVIPMEDVQFNQMDNTRLPVYRLPELSRQVRQAPGNGARQFQQQPLGRPQYDVIERSDDNEGSESSGYAAAAASTSPDHVDYGAYTGGAGAFGWYTG